MKDLVNMPSGTYYVGDLCYVMRKEWNEVCSLIISGRGVLDGKFTLADGREFVLWSTAYGDGTYQDQFGCEYSVDAGIIGAIKVNDVREGIEVRLGNIIDFKDGFDSFNDSGVLHFGNIRINTAWEDCDDDEEAEAEAEAF